MNKKTEEIYINKSIALTVLITLCAFIACLTVMVTCMITDAIGDKPQNLPVMSDGEDGDEGGESDGNKVRPGDKTGIILPSASADGDRLGVVGDYTQDVTGDTDIDSAAIVLVDITDNKVVAGKGFDQKVYPASMTKVMTLLIACENAKDPNALLTVTDEMIDEYKKASNKGASVAFEWKAGYQVTVEDALHLVIYQSDTFACWLLAEYVSGGEEAFVELMNVKAKDELGCTGTNFKNCTGLYNEQHYTTCRDMAAIMAAAMNNPAAKAVLGSYEKYNVDIYEDGEISGDPMGMWCAWYTSRLEAYKYANTAPYYAGKGSDIMIVGGKTGYETVPMSCFVTAGVDTETGREYVCVQVGRLSKEDKEINTSASTYDTRTMYWKYAKEPD